MDALIGAAFATALLVGFLAGLLTFKRSLRWCPGCGAMLRCPDCPGHRPAQSLSHGARARNG